MYYETADSRQLRPLRSTRTCVIRDMLYKRHVISALKLLASLRRGPADGHDLRTWYEVCLTGALDLTDYMSGI